MTRVKKRNNLGYGVRGTGYGVRGTGYGVRGTGYGVLEDEILK